MPGQQNAPRKDVNPLDSLSAFDTEERDIRAPAQSAFDTEEHDIRPPAHSAFSTVERDIRPPAHSVLDTEERDIRPHVHSALDSEELDIRPAAHVLPLRGHSDPPYVLNGAVPVARGRATRNVGIALLVIGSIGLAFSSRLLMGSPGDLGASAPPTDSVSQPTPDKPSVTPNVVPPAPPVTQSPARTDTPAATVTPSDVGDTKAPTAPAAERPARQAASPPAMAERPARQAGPPPVVANVNAPGGLFAITRPVGARVFLDDKLIGTTPLFLSGLAVGSHQVRFELPGFKTWSSSIRIEPNTRFRLAVQLDE
jgi:hypothetical protein